MRYRLLTRTPVSKRAGIADSFDLPPGTSILGRSDASDVQLAHPTISGRHARIDVGPDGCLVHDLGSANGTLVNGDKIDQPTLVKHGEWITMGAVVFEVEAHGAPAAAPAPASQEETRLPRATVQAAPEAPPPALDLSDISQQTRAIPLGQIDEQKLEDLAPVPAAARMPRAGSEAGEGFRVISPRSVDLGAESGLAEAQAEEEPETKEHPPPPKRRFKVPTILQMEAVECGAAALAMVLAYYDRWVPAEQLRVDCGVSRDGSKAVNILKCARRYGMLAKGMRYGDIEDLYDLERPVVLFWNFNHFVVLEGFGRKRAFINDPGSGPRAVSLDELDGSFSGIALTFEPGEDFEPGGEPPDVRGALRRRLRGSEAALTFVVICGLFLVLPGLVIPSFTRLFIDEILIAGRQVMIRPLLTAMLIAALLVMALTRYQEYYLLRLETKLSLGTSARFFRHILRLPVSFFGQRHSGEIGSRVLINDRVATLLSGRLATTVLDSLLVVFYAALMLTYDVGMTLLGIGLSLGNLVALRLASRPRTDASRRWLQEQGKLTGTSTYGLTSIETLKATGSESNFFSRWAGHQARTLRAEQDLAVISNLIGVVPALVQALITASVLLLGGAKVMAGEMSMGTLIAYQTLMMGFARPLGGLVGFGSSMQELRGDMSRLDDVLNHDVDPIYDTEEAEASTTKVKLDGHVELRDVVFGYSPVEAPLIEGFSLTLEPGRRVALVGSSGSGKSTVAKLVAGVYQPWEGEILFDGTPRNEIPRSLISNSVAVVDQDIFLFGDTIRSNITMWDSTIDVTRMTQATRDAEIHDVIETREDAFDAVVEEGGGNFSGGQRQRLEIARALVVEPSILILDEATSALDPKTEQEIDNHLRRRGCSCLIVAHRLSTIRDCDEIIVMEWGQIVQRGTHEQMKDVDGPYASLIRE